MSTHSYRCMNLTTTPIITWPLTLSCTKETTFWRNSIVQTPKMENSVPPSFTSKHMREIQQNKSCLSKYNPIIQSYPKTIHHTHASIHCGPSAPSKAQPARPPSIRSCLTAQSSNSWLLPVLTRNAPAWNAQQVIPQDSRNGWSGQQGTTSDTYPEQKLPGFKCCKQSALIIWTVSFVRAQCNDIRSLAASKSWRVSILLAADGNLMECLLTFPFPCNHLRNETFVSMHWY